MNAKQKQPIAVVRDFATAPQSYDNPRVNALIYDHAGDDLTEADWLEASLACLDQAGFPVKDQRCIETILRASFDRRGGKETRS